MANREQKKKAKEGKQEEKKRKSLDQQNRMKAVIDKKKLRRILKSNGPAVAAVFAADCDIQSELKLIARGDGLLAQRAKQALEGAKSKAVKAQEKLDAEFEAERRKHEEKKAPVAHQ